MFGRWRDELPVTTIGNWASDVVVSYVKRVLSGYDVALAASGELVTKLKDLGVGRVEHVQLGVDLDMWHPRCRDAGVRQELGINENSLVLISSGRIDVEKKVRVLCEAVERLPDELDPVLVLVGQGPLEQEMRSLAAKSSRLRVLPYERDKSQLARVMASADLYLAGNPAETFGLGRCGGAGVWTAGRRRSIRSSSGPGAARDRRTVRAE